MLYLQCSNHNLLFDICVRIGAVEHTEEVTTQWLRHDPAHNNDVVDETGKPAGGAGIQKSVPTLFLATIGGRIRECKMHYCTHTLHSCALLHECTSSECEFELKYT